MPQPLSRFHPTVGCAIATGAIPHTPEMAVAIATVINFWAQIEYNYGAITARIAKADPISVTAVFQAMVSADARKTALINAARARLTAEQSALIEAVIDTMKASRGTRNEFAHHLWGSVNGRADCVVLAPPKAMAKYAADTADWLNGGAQGPQPEIDRSTIMVWRQVDFDAAVIAAKEAHDRAVQLSFTFDHSAADHRRQSLLTDSHIQRRYNHFLTQNAFSQPG